MNLYTAQKVRQWLGQSGGLRQKVELPPGRPPYSCLTLGLEEELRMKEAGRDVETAKGTVSSVIPILPGQEVSPTLHLWRTGFGDTG